MWKAIQRAQRRIHPARIRYSKLGVTGVASVVALVLIFVAAALLDLRGDDADVGRFGVFASENKTEPVAAIVNAGQSRRFLFLADVYNSDDAKRLAGDVIEKLAEGPGLDAVLLEVGHDQQPYIDRYFDVAPEDASVLLSHPRTVHDPSPASRAYLELYHRIWKMNEKLGADRRIRVIAADLNGWPDERALSPSARAKRFGDRPDSMLAVLHNDVLRTNSRARVLIFMTGLHALRSGSGMLQTGGTAPVDVRWFAARLAQRYPGEVVTVLTDASGGGSPDELVQFLGTELGVTAKDVLPAGRYVLPVNSEFDFLSQPIRARSIPGLSFDLLPRDIKLRDVADLYLHLGH